MTPGPPVRFIVSLSCRFAAPSNLTSCRHCDNIWLKLLRVGVDMVWNDVTGNNLPPLNKRVLISVNYPCKQFVTVAYLEEEREYGSRSKRGSLVWRDCLNNANCYSDDFVPDRISTDFVNGWNDLPSPKP